jgi:uncharacterized peroxidase-related enzyme
MSRITIPTRDSAPDASRPILDAFTKQLGFTPNLFAVMSLSPNALTGWAALQGALAKTLDPKTRDGIALAVSQVNACHYCLSAHTHVATNFAKMDAEEIALNRQGRSGDAKRDPAVQFAKKLIELRGKVSEADLNALRESGYTDANVVEIIALSAQFLLTNFINNVFDTEIDFPVVAPEVA